MIGNFEIQRPDLNLLDCVINYSDLTQAGTLFLCRPDFQFNSTTDFQTMTAWTTAIDSDYIFTIHNIIESIDQSEDIILIESRQNFRYQSRPGKYRFAFVVNVDVQYYAKLLQYAGQNLKLFLADINNNLIGYLSGNAVKPFDLDNISVRKIPFGTSAPSLTQIIIDFYDPSQFASAYVFKPQTFFANYLGLPFYSKAASQAFTRNNCGGGYTGSEVVYTVPQGAHNSIISQQAADQLALDDIEDNGQDYANANGTCTINSTLVYDEFDNWSGGLPVGWVKSNTPPVITNETDRLEILVETDSSPDYKCLEYDISPAIVISDKIKVSIKVDAITNDGAFNLVMYQNSGGVSITIGSINTGVNITNVNIPGTLGSFTLDQLYIEDTNAGAHPHNITIDYIKIEIVE